ncbi:hypothetical protein [Microbulbifer yueqingensis]|uniref:Uncharacterized protein n=1 Tax=Microbulbifer yueqingensis TaxID=658219 RepID=A0A1G9AK14_9GAMM|nr:hypothetical protein [Microbulbifer yueqingensis]SDK27667.1 hypothetical protein SAMN05216212_2050 [Microbulbifer yueqingensis]
MGKRLLYRREDRVILKHLFIWLECLALFMAAVLLALWLLA